MNKCEIFKELEIEELIGTPFEDMVEIINFKEGKSLFFDKISELPAFYILEGRLQLIIYKPQGGEFYLDLFPGDLFGVNSNLISLTNKKKSSERIFEGEVTTKTDSIVVTLPFGKILDMKLDNKEVILKKLLFLSVKEGIERSRYLFYKSAYSDEELLITILEKRKILEATTKELSEFLNVNLRTLQRIIKNLVDNEIIEKTSKTIRLIDQDKLDNYKIKFEK